MKLWLLPVYAAAIVLWLVTLPFAAIHQGARAFLDPNGEL